MKYDKYLERIIIDSIEDRAALSDLAAGLKEISGKLDTLIALEQVALKAQLPQQQPKSSK